MTPQARATAIRSGDRRALARAITLVESTRRDHRIEAQALLAELAHGAEQAGDSESSAQTEGSEPVARVAGAGVRPSPAIRIGISGTPGVGKSTFIEAFGLHLTRTLGLRLAVLAVDPSSSRTGGSILGDKTRMSELNREGGEGREGREGREGKVFIRPSPTSGTLGGVARRTREAMLLCEAAGFDVILVETVGVGQSEVAVARMTDAFVLLVAPGGGDELQGVKRGIMELADLLVVNKCDGDLERVAMATASDYASALHLTRPGSHAWSPEVLLASAVSGRGIPEVWEALVRFQRATAGDRKTRRAEQNVACMWEDVRERLTQRFHHDPLAIELEGLVRTGRVSPTVAAERLVRTVDPDHDNS